MLNLTPAAFWELSWPEFWMLYIGWQVRRQHEHEHTRYLAAMMVNTSMGAPKGGVKPQSLYPLEEVDGIPKAADPAQIEAFRQRISQRLGREITFMKVA